MGIEDYFRGIESAKSAGGGQFFKGEGKFVCTTKRMWVNKGHKGKFFIVEVQVDESTSDTDPVGCTRSWTLPLEGERASRSLGDIKNIVFALSGSDPKDIGDPSEDPGSHREAAQYAMAACDEEYATKNKIDPETLIGVQVRLETNVKITKANKPFTVHTWSPYEAAA